MIRAYDVVVCGCASQANAHEAEESVAVDDKIQKLEAAADSSQSGSCQVSLVNPRVLVDLRKEADALGYPDGIKCDEHGNIYTGCGGGVRVYEPDGTFLGRFAIEGGVANLCFGGPDGKTLLYLNEMRAFAVQMKVRGALVGP